MPPSSPAHAHADADAVPHCTRTLTPPVCGRRQSLGDPD